MAKKIKGDLLRKASKEWDAEDLKNKQGIARGLKKLSGDGRLTGDLLKEARGRATHAGVTDEQFDSFMGKNKIRQNDTPATSTPYGVNVGSTPPAAVGSTPIPTAPTTSTPQTAPLTPPSVGAQPTPSVGASSPEAATQKVMSENNYGTGLGALEAMQDDKYVLGSGSSLSEPARSIGPESGKYRRAARRLRRKGYGAAAQQMAMQGEKIRLGEPAIDTEDLRAQRASQKMLAGREAMKQDRVLSDLDKRRNKRRNNQGKGKETPLAVEFGSPPLNNNNGGGSKTMERSSDEDSGFKTAEGRSGDDLGSKTLEWRSDKNERKGSKTLEYWEDGEEKRSQPLSKKSAIQAARQARQARKAAKRSNT